MKDDDRRIRRTRRALASALLELATSRPYESITIRDITDKADIGYATFFRHYSSKDELMLGIFKNLADELEALASQHKGDYFQNEGVLIFRQVEQNKALYRSILDSLVFSRKLRNLFAEHIRVRVVAHISNAPKLVVPLEVAVNHMAASFVSLIEWWIEHDMQPSVETMA